LSVLLIAAAIMIRHRTHRLPAAEPLHGDPENIAAPLPLDVADAMTARELAAEEESRRAPDPQLPAA
jgi:hypothetical protein